MEQFKPQTNAYRKSRILQVILIAVFAIVYLFCILTGQSPATGIFHILFFLVILVNIIYLYFDFTRYTKALTESDEIKKTAYLDDLTGMPNRFSCDLVFQMYAKNDSIRHVGCALIIIDNLVALNEQIGRDAGNQAIIDFSNILEEVGEDFGFVGRNGGNEFLLVIEKCSAQQMDEFFSRLNTRLKRYNALALNNPIQIYYRYVLNEELQVKRFSDLITEVYKRVYNREK